MATKQLQHNTPTGWKPCKATKRACKYVGASNHRIGETTKSLERHQASIDLASADGKIDAVERAALSKEIADSVFNKVDPAAVDSSTPSFGHELNISNRMKPDLLESTKHPSASSLGAIRKNYNRALGQEQLLAKYEDSKQMLDFAKEAHSYNSPQVFEEQWKNGTYEGKGATEEEARATSALDYAKTQDNVTRLQANYDEFHTKVDNAVALATRSRNAFFLQKEDIAHWEDKTVHLDGLDYNELDTDFAVGNSGISVGKYNNAIGRLVNNPDYTDSEKEALVKSMRNDLVRNGLSSYRAQESKGALEKISSFFNRDSKEKKADIAVYDRAYTTLLRDKLSVFSKALLNAPWDATIKD
jgi:hypothetical protein